MEMKKGSIMVVFGDELPKVDLSQYDTILKGDDLVDMIESGSVYEASALIEELSCLKLPNGQRVSKSFIYEGFELWWVYYNNIYTDFCLPYTQYKKLFRYLRNFQSVHLYKAPYKTLFSSYLRAYGCKINIVRQPGFKSPAFLPFGIVVQIFLSLISLLILLIKRPSLMVFIGDKLEKSQDYDFRMKNIYLEIRARGIHFVEFIRSLESWKIILEHFFKRRRPVVYSEAVALVGRFLSFIFGGHFCAKKQFGHYLFISETVPEVRFKLLIATHHLRHIYDDVWTIRIMKWILYVIGIKTSLFTAVLERNFHAFAGSKLNNIPTVGIFHGVAPRNYAMYDFLPGFDGEKMLTVDKYGLWSDWLKEYYLKHSKAYRPDQLYVSGPMRPFDSWAQISASQKENLVQETSNRPVKVLFVSEQLADPKEALVYIDTLLADENISLTIKFRPYRDGFEEWLLKNKPDLLERKNITILRDNIQDAIKECDVVVGSHSTAVLEALLQNRVPIFFYTKKWGDCFSLREYAEGSFFAETPEELIEKVKNTRTVLSGDLNDLRERYFGDQNKSGSKWIVDQVSASLFVK